MRRPSASSDELAEQAQNWIESVTGIPLPPGKTLHQNLKTGMVLCRVANTLERNSVPRVNASPMPFKQMENISAFIGACRGVFGLRESDLFTTADLFEDRNMQQVVSTVLALKRLRETAGSSSTTARPLPPAPPISAQRTAAKHRFGASAPKCPVCKASVYAAEKITAVGKDYHRGCFKCGDCKRGLQPAEFSDHEGTPYCTACYGRLYRPKGFGFGAAGAGLNTEEKLPPSVVSVPVTTQAAPPAVPAARSRFCTECGATITGAAKFCGECGTAVTSVIAPPPAPAPAPAPGPTFVPNLVGKQTQAWNKSLAQAAAPAPAPVRAPAAAFKKASRFGGAPKCPVCKASVYAAEKISAMGKDYHKACFKCGDCKRGLQPAGFSDHDGTPYCTACYGRLYRPKGFGFGAAGAGLNTEEKQSPSVSSSSTPPLAAPQSFLKAPAAPPAAVPMGSAGSVEGASRVTTWHSEQWPPESAVDAPSNGSFDFVAEGTVKSFWKMELRRAGTSGGYLRGAVGADKVKHYTAVAFAVSSVTTPPGADGVDVPPSDFIEAVAPFLDGGLGTDGQRDEAHRGMGGADNAVVAWADRTLLSQLRSASQNVYEPLAQGDRVRFVFRGPSLCVRSADVVERAPRSGRTAATSVAVAQNTGGVNTDTGLVDRVFRHKVRQGSSAHNAVAAQRKARADSVEDDDVEDDEWDDEPQFT